MRFLSNNTERTGLLVLIGFSATFGLSLAIGYNIGVINNPAPYIQSWYMDVVFRRYGTHLSEAGIDILWSSMVSILLIGGAIGSASGSYLADRFGRKGSYIISSALFIFGAVLFLVCRIAESVEIFLIARFIAGIASGLTTSTLPMYLTEIVPLGLRGTFGSLCPIGLTGGIVVGQIISLRSIFGTENLWECAMAFYGIFVIIALIPSFYYPESPKYLFCVKNDRNRAEHELYRLRGDNKILVDKELEEMTAQAIVESKSQSLISILKDPTLRLPLVIVCCLQGGQMLSGINAVFLYSISIYERAGLSTSEAEWANLGAGVLNFAVCFLCPYLMASFNRRFFMMWSCGMSGIFLGLLAVVLCYVDIVSWFPTASIVCILIYILFFEIGLGPLPYFIASEIFEVGPRSTAMSLGSSCFWICNFIVGMSFPLLQKLMGAFVFIPYAVVCILLVFLTKFYVPETKNLQPGEIRPLVANGFRSRPNAKNKISKK